MPILDCPHCGVTVHFSANGVCPSCLVARDAPVSTSDRARIEAVWREPVEREARDQAPPKKEGGLQSLVRGIRNTLIVLMFGSFPVLIALQRATRSEWASAQAGWASGDFERLMVDIVMADLALFAALLVVMRVERYALLAKWFVRA